MKFTIKRNELLNGLNKVHGVAEKHNAIDILSNVLIEVKENRLYIVSTDTVLEVSNSIECLSDVDGKTTINAYTFHDIIKRLSIDNDVSIELIDSQLLIKSGKSKFNIGVLDADGFPVMLDDGYNVDFKLSKDDLNLLINKVKYAVSGEELRYYLNGICWHGENGKLNAVSTDSHRLALSSVDIDLVSLDKVIIPLKACNIVSRLMDSEISDIDVSVSDSKIKFVFNSTTIVTKLIDGQFPDYERIIPKDNSLTVGVNTKDFMDCINRVSSVLDTKSNGVRLEFSNDILTIKSSNNSNTASDELSCESNGLNLKIGLNVKYLKDVLSSLDSNNTMIYFRDDETPIIVKADNNDAYKAVIMPLRV